MDTPSFSRPEPALAPSPSPAALAPIAVKERIEALDVVRGFALIGICIMNVDFFNRSINALGTGIPAGLSGINWWAAWFNAYFVVGKFWTIFSLLFGMGFAVMLQQAEKAGRPFLKTYLRRIAALALFGAFHHIFIWPGDILFSYAVGAVGLLLVLFGTWRVFVTVLLVLIGLAMVPKMGAAAGFAAPVAIFGLLALYLRFPRTLALKKLDLPLLSWILAVVALLATVSMAASWFVPAMKEARAPLCIFSVIWSIMAFLSARFYQPLALRSLRTGAGLYVMMFTIGLSFGVLEYLSLASTKAQGGGGAANIPAASAAASTSASAPASTPASAAASAAASTPASTPASAAAKAASASEKKPDRQAQRAKRQKEREEATKNENRVLSTGTYLDALKLRATHFVEHSKGEGFFSIMLVAMFLIGNWFVRSGIMANTAQYLPLFRKLAWFAWPLGIGMGLAGSMLTTRFVPGVNNGWDIAFPLLMMGNLPACLGYVAMVILMLHSSGPFSKIRILAPFGRMALTNYLMQSVIASLVFYSYGMGLYGMGRAAQFGYVALVIALQIGISHWWLANFRYGPMEWLWRAVTYWQIPPMRLEPALPEKAAAPGI
ncbi:MAG: hypothetical protein RL748_2473 [Pseudomonadota bacterium]